MKKLLLKALTAIIVFVLLMAAGTVLAVPALNIPKEHIQPDGSVIEVYLYGDEYYHFTGDAEGYLLELNEDGAYEYVTTDAADSGNTGVMYSAALDDGSRPANAVKGFDLRPEKSEEPQAFIVYDGSASASDSGKSYSSALSSTFTPSSVKETPMLVIAVDFMGTGLENKLSQTFHSPEKIHDLFFNEDNSVVGVNSYYNEVSGGRQQFTPAFKLDSAPAEGYGKVADGVIKIKLDYEHPDTIDNNTKAMDNAIVEKLISDIMTAADEYIDFSVFNTDESVIFNGVQGISNDELIISIIAAGYEAAANNFDNSVWAHAGSLMETIYDIIPEAAIKKKGNSDTEFYYDENGNNVYDANEAIFSYDSGKDCYVYNADISYTNDGNGNYCYSYRDVIRRDGVCFIDNITGGKGYVSKYNIMGAMYDNTHAMGIGSFCHELGHVLGLPDLYNTFDQDDDYGDVGVLSLMCSGNWCKKGTGGKPSDLPSHLDAWSKLYLGWYDESDLLEIDYDDKLTAEVLTTLSEKSGYKYIKVNTTDENEYYLIENRAFEGYDKGLPYYGGDPVDEAGIAIWRIDEEVIEQYFASNKINNTDKPGIKLIRNGKGGGSVFYNSSKPLWTIGVNRMPLLNKQTIPSSALNTYENVTGDSGVSVEIMSLPGESMHVRFGGGNVVTAITSEAAKVSAHVYNDSDKDATYTTILTLSDKDTIEDVVVLPEITAPAGEECVTTSVSGVSLKSGEYRALTWNMGNLKPYADMALPTYKK